MKLSFMFFSFSVLSEAFYTGFVFARGITLQIMRKQGLYNKLYNNDSLKTLGKRGKTYNNKYTLLSYKSIL